MRLHNPLRILATAAALAVGTAPAAYASDIGEGGGGLPPTNHHVTAAPQHSGSGDWGLIAIAGAGTAALAAAGISRSRHTTRHASDAEVRPPRPA